ncbi:hypothetical protein E4U44_002233 [Claviceps purpurea]|nr:hypothetical protein E4U44_002233 [Claviceps purpurea]
MLPEHGIRKRRYEITSGHLKIAKAWKDSFEPFLSSPNAAVASMMIIIRSHSGDWRIGHWPAPVSASSSGWTTGH